MVKVLYIVGSSRCGSTVLSDVLGELDGFFAGGEIRFLWDRVLQGRRCGCGLPVDHCDIWKAVLPDGGEDREEVRGIAVAQRTALRLHRTPLLLRRSRTHLLRSRELSRYLWAMTEVYGHLEEVTDAKVIVDSSKRPSNAAALRLIDGIEPYLLHLVRDPRGVAYSRLRRKANPDGAGEMPIVTARYSAVDWVGCNLAAADLRRRFAPQRSLFLRYEDFVSAPRAAMERITALLGERMLPDPFVGASTVNLGPNHTVSGNPDRFHRGPLSIHADVEWVSRMRPGDRRTTAILTLPLLLRYGYRVRPAIRDAVQGGPAADPIGDTGRGDGGTERRHE